MDHTKPLSPLIDLIAKEFPQFYVSVFTNGMSQTIIPAYTQSDVRPFEVCFVPRLQMRGLPALLYYKAEWRALMIAAVDWPEQVFPALTIHELGHALYHRQGRPSATAPPTSDSYIEEEITMHELESLVLNSYSDGGYFQTIDELLRKYRISDTRDLDRLSTSENFLSLDKALRADQTSVAVASILAAQHELAVGMRFIDATEEDHARRLQKKIALYRHLRFGR